MKITVTEYEKFKRQDRQRRRYKKRIVKLQMELETAVIEAESLRRHIDALTSEDAATREKALALFTRTEAVEGKMRDNLPAQP